MFDGKGTVFKDGISKNLEIKINYEDFYDIDDIWNSFEGIFIQDSKEGQGTYHFCNEDKFTCLFRNNLPNG